ncbi:MAG TPA: efflux RND transporter permease subunit [Methylomirabilota bacterium]|nr:efflux RND transporter permease subunit [Methylomirabilota bacterium]
MKDSRRGPLAWFAANHVAANILMIFILASGILAIFNIVIEVFPELDTGVITVRVPYRGATPAEAEEGVCVRVEEAIASIEGIKRIRSTASENLGTVTIELEEDADTSEALDEIKAAVDRIETFPSETEKPVVAEVDSRRRVITVVLYGDASEKTLKALAERVRDDLTDLEAISQVEVAGVRNYEISIEVSEESLRRYGLSFEQVANAVAASSLDLPGGAVKTRGGEILLRTKGQLYRGAEFEHIVVLTRPDGTRVELGDVATVVDGFEDTDTATRFDGRRAALIQVYRVGNEGALQVAAATKRYLEDLTPSLPEGVSAETWDDDSIILKQRIGLLLRNARLGLVLVFICLALFLETRLAFWTTMGIPISFLGGLWLVPAFDVSINMISLFAFIVVLGIVVDDAIVVGENIFNYIEQGLKPLDAAIRGVREMAMPVTFAIITTVAAFAPLLFVSGNMGKVMRQIPVVVIAVLLMSLVEALFILPAHLSGSGSLFNRVVGPVVRPLERLQALVQRGLRWWIRVPYRRSLAIALEWRYLTMAAAVAVLLLSVSVVAGGFLKFSFMPKVDADTMSARLTMPQGTPVEQTAEVLERLETAAMALAASVDEGRPDGAPSVVRHISTTIGQHPSAGTHGGPMATQGAGGDSSHLGEVNVELLGAEERELGSGELLRRWRELVGEVPGAVSLIFQANLFSAGDPVSVQLSHRNFDTLLAAVDRLKGIIAEYPGTRDVADSFLPGKKELKLTLTPEGRAAGLTLSDLASQVRAGFYGREVQRVQRGRDDIRVMVRYPEDERRSLGDIDAMRIRLPDGSEVPFPAVAAVEEGRGYAVINRTDRRRVVTVTADVDEAMANANEISADLRRVALPALARDFPGLVFDFEGEQREQNESLGSLRVNFFVAQLAIFALLAIPFRSYSQPLIIMSAIPFGLVGAVLGHLVMGLNLTMLSMFGMVALTGVVVNDSLILIDLINRERAAGATVDQAIRDSGERRFRPIMLTTATTFLGLTPMIFETSMQARFLIPMAVSLGYGIVFATAITLILVPTLYRILEDLRALLGLAEDEASGPDQIQEDWAAEEGA